MKKLLMLCITGFLWCFFFSASASAVTWHVANQSTVGWDAVTTLEDGSPLPADNAIEYVCYLANSVTDPNKANPTEVARTANVQQVITLNVEGRFYFGVKAIRKLADGTIVNESPISWSDDATKVASGDTFGLSYFLPPAAPGNVNLK
jgi:hypothetical protein